jgi:AraC family transcriptional regulator, regulatory protein of adaptative response / DNA-3-methyladenine glycosylase II
MPTDRAQRELGRTSRLEIHVRKPLAGRRGAAYHRAMLDLSNAECHAALRARDRRFDGRFFVGVTSTRIYCRPVCSVRTPKAENCRFFPSAAAAEGQGFRPCLRCRPELAPGLASIDATERYATAAARLIEQGFLSDHRCEALAARLGITDRHLRRVFAERFGVSPVAYAQSQRLLLAKRLLTDTHLPITEVALASGFGSSRRFNEVMQARYRLSPSDLRRSATRASALSSAASAAVPLRLKLCYRPPLDWPGLCQWIRVRAIAGLEAILTDEASGGPVHVRTLSLRHADDTLIGWIRVGACAREPALWAEVSPGLTPALPQVLARLRRLYDLDASPQDIASALGPLAGAHPGLRLPGAATGWEGAARAVLEQQVSTAAATTLLTRLTQQWGEPLPVPQTPAGPGIDRLFPTAATLAAQTPDSLAAGLRVPRTRATALVLLAQAAESGTLPLEDIADVETGMARLRQIPGIGPWTAGYIAMRAWAWPDQFLPNDVIVRQRLHGLPPQALDAWAARWRPWRSYAVFHLWAGGSVEALHEPAP